MQLLNADNGDVLLNQLDIASTFWTRFKGLQFRHSIPKDAGLLLSPCSSLHTCFMRFPIDVIMLDFDRVVVGVRTCVRPWRAMLCDPGTKQVIEVNVGAVDVSKGTKLEFWQDDRQTS